MKPISRSAENIFQPVQLREDEYLDEESKLIYCSRCRTPRQKRFEMTGKLFEPRCMCACQTAAYEQREHSFENDLGYNPKQMNMAKRFVENWDEFRKNSMGLLLWGNVGTGKSFIAGCIANALLDKGVPVMMTNFARLLNKLTDMYSGDRNAYIDSFNSFPLLIIDDLGVERNSEFAREQVFNIIDSRYRSQLPMIVTTNLTVDELKNPADLARARIYDRVLERCTAIKVNDQNIRKLNMAENLAKAKKLLEGVTV